ncbi:hypothetical protein [Xanthomonas arboricola]|uniref:hypothetical protein n=1 Tax=Xanthomonas arboricola TaxID=56448 RepID=UPI0011B065FD|nr:hypothetical protein [Xanthomonas arboricola]
MAQVIAILDDSDIHQYSIGKCEMKIRYAFLVLLVAAFTAHAIRHQPNQLTRIYYHDSAKTQWAGHGMLSCPIYANNDQGWVVVDGVEAPYFTEIVGPKCQTGAVVPTPCWADAACPPISGH